MNDEKAGDYFEKLESHKASLWEGRSVLRGRLDIELTERCSNNCIHCYINLPAHDRSARERELSTQKIKEILEEAASLNYIKVRFTGGEPLLREDFEELYIFARRLGLKVTLFTNATLITPHLVKLFARIPPLVNMGVTVYGMSRGSYEAVTRTSGSYEAAWRGINLLLEKQIPFTVKGALLPPNKGELEQLEAWASTIPWMDSPPPQTIFFDLRGRRDSDVKDRLIKGLRLSIEEEMKILTKGPEAYLKGKREFCSRFIRPPGDVLFSCGSGLDSVCVDAYGYVQPCMLLRHPDVVYDLSNGSLKDALTDFFPKIRKMKATNPDYLAKCAHCFLKGLCEQCPAKSWMEHGTLDTPVEYCCEIAHEQARYLRMLEDGEKAWEVKDWRERIKNIPETEAERRNVSGKSKLKIRNGGKYMEIKVDLEAVYSISEDVVSREIEGEILIVPLVSGIGDMEDELFNLNETGKAIWQRLDGQKNLREVVEEISGEFEAPKEEIEQDVKGFVEELLKRGMVVDVSKV